MNLDKGTINILTGLAISLIGWYGNRAIVFIRTNKLNLLTHSVLQDLQSHLLEINTWIVPKNREVFRLMLTIKLSIWYNQIKLLIKEINEKGFFFSRRKLEIYLKDWLFTSIQMYYNEWRKEGVPEILISKVSALRQPKIERAINQIERICNSDYYISTKLRVVAFLDLLNLLLTEAKGEFLDYIFMREFNGDLEGVKFKGLEINPYKEKQEKGS